MKFEGRDLEAESSGSSAGSAGAPVSRHPGAAGEVGDWLMRWEFGKQNEIRKVKLENSEEKTPAHAAHEWGTRQLFRLKQFSMFQHLT